MMSGLGRLRLDGALLMALATWVTTAAAAVPLVETASGRVAGTQTQDVAVFRGLPYPTPRRPSARCVGVRRSLRSPGQTPATPPNRVMPAHRNGASR